MTHNDDFVIVDASYDEDHDGACLGGVSRDMTTEEYLLAEAEIWAQAPNVAPCPTWCDGADCRIFDAVDISGGHFTRTHVRTVSPAVQLTQDEYAYPTGLVKRFPVQVDVCERDSLNAGTVRQVAADLLTAADLLDEIAGGPPALHPEADRAEALGALEGVTVPRNTGQGPAGEESRWARTQARLG